jgi:hypothetical protein
MDKLVVFARGNAVLLGFFLVIAVAYLALRQDQTALQPGEGLPAALSSGQYTVLEFYSNA